MVAQKNDAQVALQILDAVEHAVKHVMEDIGSRSEGVAAQTVMLFHAPRLRSLRSVALGLDQSLPEVQYAVREVNAAMQRVIEAALTEPASVVSPCPVCGGSAAKDALSARLAQHELQRNIEG